MIGSAAARMVGSSRSSASRWCSTPSNHPFSSSSWIFRSSRSMPSSRIGLQRRGAALPHQRVGILSLRHRRHPDPDTVSEQLVPGAEGGAEAGGITVVEQGRRRREPAQQPGLLRRERGAQRRHDVLDAREDQAEYVEVALHQDDRFLFPDGRLRLVQVVELLSLVEDRRLGRVEILGLARHQQPAAESGHPAAQIVDGEEQPRPEPRESPCRRPARR